MENFTQVLKIFIEKHLIPSVISVAGAIITLLLLPEDNYIIQKLGKLLFVFLAFCVYFLLVQCFLKVCNSIPKAVRNIQKRNHAKQQRKEETQNEIEEIHEFFDRLEPEDKDVLLGFIKNGNKILLDFSVNPMQWNLRQIMNISECKYKLRNIDKNYYWFTKTLETADDDETFYFKQYKIQKEIFEQLEYVYKKEGKLGHF